MPRIFCDVNFIVTTHQETQACQQHLIQLAAAGTVTFALSPMHWVEAAEDNDAVPAASKADFMDSLQANWIYERLSIQRKEVADAFFRCLGVPANPPQMVTTVCNVIADLAGVPAQRNSRDFVAHLRGIWPNHPVERSIRRAFESNRVNVRRFR